ncbi:MAG TPA: 6-bladed beta-propeller, partial [Draconibacterium sp.]|nr:6-bladed beta-propeller [Draconibacterium sp.]
VDVIKFHFNDRNPTYEEVFKETKIIPLETNANCLVSEITQMEVMDDKIFILDWKLNSLLVFNIHGKFLNRIGTVGRGPGEYIRPRHFFINKDEALVKVFDAPTMKLMCFNYNGTLIKEIKLNYYLTAIGDLPTGGYWGYCSNVANDTDSSKEYLKFITFKPNGEVNQFVDGIKNPDRVNYTNTYISCVADGSVSFVEPYLPNIYWLKDGEIVTKYKIDYSGHFLSNKMLKKVEDIKPPIKGSKRKLLDIINRDYANKFMRFFENDDWLVLVSFYKGTSLFYNKKSKKSHEFSKYLFSELTSNIYFIKCKFLSGSSIYSECSQGDIKSLLKSQNKTDKQKESLNKMLESRNPEDNPLIIKYVINE